MANVSQFSTSASSNNQASPDGAPEGWAPSDVNNWGRELMAALARWYQDTNGTLVTTGTGNAYALSTNSSHSALADISLLVFRADRANTGAATLAVDGLATKAIVKANGDALVADDIKGNQLVAVVYNATVDKFLLLSVPGNVGDADSVDGKEPATTTAETDGLVYWSSGTINSTGLLLQATNDGGIKQDTNYSVDTFLATGLVSSDPGLSFGTWRTPSASRPTWVIIDVLVVTDGSANSLVQVQVDDAGGTVADYTLSSEADEGLGANGVVQDSITLFLRPTASYRVTNPQDAAFLNAINNIREYEL